MTSDPRGHDGVALLVPCHNGARFLPRLWASVRAQTAPFDECIVYDDGSTDDSAQIARSLGAQVIVGHGNRGPSAARNALLQATRCRRVHFHDADDALHPDFVLRMSAFADQTTADVVLCGVDWLDETGQTTTHRWRYNDRVYSSETAVSDMISNVIGGIGGVYRVEALRKIGGFRPELRYWEDLDLHLRLWKSGASIRVLDQVLAYAFRHAASTSNSNLRAVWRAKASLLNEYLNDKDLSALVAPAVARAAEDLINRQLSLLDLAGARLSFELALRVDSDLPTSSSRFIQLTKPLFGAWCAIRLQHWLRRQVSRTRALLGADRPRAEQKSTC